MDCYLYASAIDFKKREKFRVNYYNRKIFIGHDKLYYTVHTVYFRHSKL